MLCDNSFHIGLQEQNTYALAPNRMWATWQRLFNINSFCPNLMALGLLVCMRHGLRLAGITLVWSKDRFGLPWSLGFWAHVHDGNFHWHSWGCAMRLWNGLAVLFMYVRAVRSSIILTGHMITETSRSIIGMKDGIIRYMYWTFTARTAKAEWDRLFLNIFPHSISMGECKTVVFPVP